MIPRKSKNETRRRLRLWGELDREDNHYIETGYRAASGSLIECLHSWSYVHNETVNIYTHLLGAAIFLALPFFIFKKEIPARYVIATQADVVVCSTYFLGVAICFCLSATYHTVMNHSQKMDAFGAQLDFQGVILLMWGATVPLLYYGFYCDFTLQRTYSTLLSVLAVTCSMSTFQPRFRDPYLRPVRAATFGSLAIFTMVPVVHGINKYGWDIQSQRMGVVWVVITLVLNVSGATAYAFKIPERWCRRRFDILGASHQIFHLMVVLAALTYTQGILQAFDFVHENDHTCELQRIG
ncbi:hemolysin-III channel protein-like protein Izh2 [Hyaloscypha sp. PMI_1271]|nr:hemolysin-III channel protein-like protein Izh2 [Hyaloscypha sp. PMI_1271]